MYFKIYKKFDQINAGLMTISDFLEKYEIVMYPNFWPIICIYYIFTLPLFNIWAPAPEELSARPCSNSSHPSFHRAKIYFFTRSIMLSSHTQNEKPFPAMFSWNTQTQTQHV